ncbi:MAG: MFS transporter [Burkholderiaceae bacterium]|jgi:predicted MFS family arabinose efflux permease|nr:MFS transporter [Burkholderiales bacterium]NBP18615.1 MFS transporter [Burkholderiaceae bacterium]NCA09140.1 MFS transporter [Burkholderiaceae bacterium]NCU93097.1 MFS transporter [Burkholderiaceae bacterium]NCV03150.1 MFS transporter [Burkholderiaceae bacterium]
MNKNLWFLTLAQGLYLTNNVTFIAINGLVGFALAPEPWLATLPVMAYVVGSAMATTLVAKVQRRLGRKRSFQIALLVAFFSSLVCAFATLEKQFWLLNLGTVIAGFYNANAQLYRFAAAELADKTAKEKAISWVLAGGILGAVLGPNMASWTRDWFMQPFAGAYITLAGVALIAIGVVSQIHFPEKRVDPDQEPGRPLSEIMRQPLFIVCTLTAALAYGVMNLLMAATPLAMEACQFSFDKTAWVLEWHVIGMFAPGFFTGTLIKRIGVMWVLRTGVALNIACVMIALSGITFFHFLTALFLLGVGWNFLFTSSTTLALEAYRPSERDKAQGAINFFVFLATALSALSSGVLITTQGWTLLNLGSIVPLTIIALALIWLGIQRKPTRVQPL